MAQRQLRHLPNDIRFQIIAKLKQFAADPQSIAGSVTRLVGSSYSRIRVGDYRVVVDHDRMSVVVIRLGHRREIYR